MTGREFAKPHLDKINAAFANVKAAEDQGLLHEARERYLQWIADLESLTLTGRDRVSEMVRLLNEYKDFLEVDLIMRRGSAFLRRQKGQLKLDNSILEEFLIHLVDPSVLPGIEGVKFVSGPQNAFMSLSFVPTSFASLAERPSVVLKSKDQALYWARESTTASRRIRSLIHKTRLLVTLSWLRLPLNARSTWTKPCSRKPQGPRRD